MNILNKLLIKYVSLDFQDPEFYINIRKCLLEGYFLNVIMII